MRIGIMQPGYLPWLGYFEQMNRCDIFVHLDTVQYTHRDWRNRNRIKTEKGIQWLTVPVGSGNRMRINEVLVRNDEQWGNKHIKAIRVNYGKTLFFKTYFQELAEILNKNWINLVDLDITLIEWLSKKLGINTKTIRASQISPVSKDKQFRLIQICKILGCDIFYEGKSGQNYIDTNYFASHGVTVEFQEYKHPYYNQRWNDEQGFISYLSIIDLLFNHGPDSLSILMNEKIVTPINGQQIRNANNYS